MKRAAVLIGVKKAGNLPPLKDAIDGVVLMENWCREQKIPTTAITDEKEPVSLDRIKAAIKPLAKAKNVGQLLVYFAGHGVNLQRQEYWLLNEAPEDPDAAVNVAESIPFAATCGFGHVVLFSDACRTAPEGIQAQSIRGGVIFPNQNLDEKPVDQFFACQLGKPSYEVKDPAVAAAEFKALYTHELVQALLGRRSQLIEWQGAGAERRGYVRLRPLRDFLSAAVADRIADLELRSKLIQVPVATISSDPPVWISELGEAAVGPGLGISGPVASQPQLRVSTPEAITADLLRATIAGPGLRAMRVSRGFDARARQAAIQEEELTRASQKLAEPFGPSQHETGCGFKLRGDVVADFFAGNAQLTFADGLPFGEDIRVGVTGPYPAVNVLLMLGSGSCVLLPAIREFICALTFDEGELIDVAYEPSTNSSRWSKYGARAQETRALRNLAASATARGMFTLEGNDALTILTRMQSYMDPSLAIYAAYAYHDLQRRDLLDQMADYMGGALSAPIFDVALLARRLDRTTLRRGSPLIGAVPMMAQGWVFLRAFGAMLPPTLASLERRRRNSLWTMFDADGVRVIRDAFAKGELL